MNLVKYGAGVVLFLFAVVPSLQAAGGSSFSKSLQQGGIVYDISSRPVAGCNANIVTVTAKRGGKKVAALKADVDHVTKTAQLVDLDGNGTAELILTGRVTGSRNGDTLDVYWLSGRTLHRVSVPEFDEKSSYRGGDRFHIEGRLIVRTVPLYQANDPADKPTGGTRTLKYDFKNGGFELYVQTEKAENTFAPAVVQDEPPAAKSAPSESRPLKSAPVNGGVTEVAATEDGIAIKVSGTPEYKVMKLEKPERIAIDVLVADSPLAGKRVAINRFGISKARVGRNKGFVRIALDTNLAAFPKYEVKTTNAGLLVVFPQ